MREQTTTAATSRWPRFEPVPLTVGAIVTGVLLDLALRSGVAALGAAATVWAIAAVALTVWRVRTPWAIGCFASAAVLAAWLVIRASPWLAQTNLAAISLLLAVGAFLGEGGSPFDLRMSTICGRSLRLLLRLVWVPGWMALPLAVWPGQVSGRQWSDAAAVARGMAIALPIVVVLGLLLGSADPVFASFFNANLIPDREDLLGHVVLIATGVLLLGWIAGGLATAYPPPRAAGGRLGSREALVVMAVIDAMFVLFAFAQIDAALGGGEAALRAAGVTYADYARSGFFQLLWVAGLMWIVIAFVRGAVPSEPGPRRTGLIVSIEVAIGLVLLIVYVAHSRLQLYEAVYTFTIARLYAHVFAWLAAAAFVLLGGSVAGIGSSRNWLFGAVSALALIAVLGLNVANPEAIVVELNVQRDQRTGDLDLDYLFWLSADARPLLLSESATLRRLQERDDLRYTICGYRQPAPAQWENYNVAALTALSAERSYCATRRG
jgi:uncharacterized protein DUF4153